MLKGRELEQLCCLGLPGEVLIPELLGRLHAAFASGWNMFLWMDARAEIVNAYAETPAFFDSLPLYFEQFHQREEYEIMGGTHKSFMREPAVVDDMRAIVRDNRKIDRSGMYNELMRPLALYNPVYVKVREGARPLGMLQLCMEDEGHDIDAAGRARLARLAPFIAHGVSAPKSLSRHGFEDDDSGVMVFDRAGALRHLSPSARKLLFLATHPQAGARQLRHAGRSGVDVPEPVRTLCRRLDAALGGEPAQAPAHAVENAWGRFVFRAYPLEPARGEAALVGVIVQRQIPTALALWRRIRVLGLPAKQAQVCFHLASGRSYADTADAMNVSINTVGWHVRELYARFDVHSAAELSRKLLGSGPA